MDLPADGYILLSLVNTALRDAYSSLDDFCAGEDADKDELCARLSSLGYKYDPVRNAFAAI